MTSLPHSEEREHRPNRVEAVRSKSGHKRSQVPGKWPSPETLLFLTGTSQLKPVTSSSLPSFSKAQANVIQFWAFLTPDILQATMEPDTKTASQQRDMRAQDQERARAHGDKLQGLQPQRTMGCDGLGGSVLTKDRLPWAWTGRETHLAP